MSRFAAVHSLYFNCLIAMGLTEVDWNSLPLIFYFGYRPITLSRERLFERIDDQPKLAFDIHALVVLK